MTELMKTYFNRVSRLEYNPGQEPLRIISFQNTLPAWHYHVASLMLSGITGEFFLTGKAEDKEDFLELLCMFLNDNFSHNYIPVRKANSYRIRENGDVIWLFQDELTHQAKQEETPKKLLIATHNKGKTAEFKSLFAPLGFDVEDLNAHPELPEVEETGTTFEENARLKAETIANLTGQMVLADDSGLMVDILGGMPGVWSARFAGNDATDEENMAKLLHELAMVFDEENRKAHFHTTLVVAKPEAESLVVEGDWDGRIAFEAKGEDGFGYDPIFLVGETDTTAAQLSPDEKNSQSHRARAVKALMKEFPAWIAKHS